MSILHGAAPAAPENLIVTICGTPGSGKTSLASTFPKPFMIRTQGESVPRDIDGGSRPAELGETDTTQKLWDQLKALCSDEHDFKTLIIDSVTGLEMLFATEILAADPKAKSLQTAMGGYGAGRDAVMAQHMRVRKAAEIMRSRRGMNVVFLAHSDINRIDPPDSDGYSQWGLRLHSKSTAPYVDSTDVVGLIKQTTILRGQEGSKKAITTGDRVLVTYMTPASITKNRLGITEDIDVVQGVNPLAPWLGLDDAEVGAKAKRGRPKKVVPQPEIEQQQVEEGIPD